MCDICHKYFKHIVERRQLKHGLSKTESSMQVCGELRRQRDDIKRTRRPCSIPDCGHQFVRIHNHLRTYHHLNKGYQDYDKFVKLYYGKGIRSPVSQHKD